MNIYCKSCGSPTAYGSKKPKFCSHCGASFDSTAKASVKPQKAPPPKQKLKNLEIEASHDEEGFEGEDNVSIPNINKIEADIITSTNRGVKIGEIAGTATEEDEAFIRPSEGAESNPSKAFDDLKREGGSIRGG